MFATITLVVCLAAQPELCETVFPNSAHPDGAPMSFFECLGAGGQSAALQWLREHPDYVARKLQCTISNDAGRARARLEQPEA